MQDSDRASNKKAFEEPNFWEIFDYEKISGHFFIRALWALFLRLSFKFYMRLKIVGNFKGFYKKYPKLIIISNHTSHLDGPVILSSIPFSHWLDLYILAARDYWFSNWYLRFFSKKFMGAIPVERKSNRSGSVQKCLNILNDLKRVWMVMFPEGTRSEDGSLQPFKKGVSLFSQKTGTPILFLYIHGNRDLLPKGKNFPLPGRIWLYIGPIQEPDDIDTIFNNYKNWADGIRIKFHKKQHAKENIKSSF